MTEKRYSKMMNHYGTSRTYCTGIYDNQNNRELQNSNQVIIELNALHEENEQLKQQIGNLEHTRDFCVDVCADCERLEKENEQLKCKIEVLQNEIDMLNGKGIKFQSIEDLKNKYSDGDRE